MTTHFLGIVAYLLRVESAMACGGSEMGPIAEGAAEGGGIEAIGTAALTEEMPQLLGKNTVMFKDLFCITPKKGKQLREFADALV